MGFFDKRHENDSPIGNLRAHIGTFMYFVKVGKFKFKHKGRIGEIFADMDNTQFLFQQATSGTMYDFKKKLDYALWDAAVHKYTEDLDNLKKELLKAVDEEKLHAKDMEEKVEAAEEDKEVVSEKEPEGDWRENLKGQMKEAEEKAKKEEEERQKEKELEAQNGVDDTEEMTETDCRELWRILQGLEREFREMNHIADDWFTANGKKNGCVGMLAAMALVPVTILYGLWHIL